MNKATRIQDLVGELSIQEEALDLKYQMELSNLESYTGDGEYKKVNTEHYVHITGGDWSQAHMYSLARTINNCRENICDYYQGTNAISGTIIGMLGEIMASKIFNVPFDHEVHLRKTKKYDIVVDGKTIDIKTNTIWGNNRDEVIVYESKKLGDSQYYMFGRILSNITFNLFGWAEEELIIDSNNIQQGKTGYRIPKYRLKKFNVKEEE